MVKSGFNLLINFSKTGWFFFYLVFTITNSFFKKVVSKIYKNTYKFTKMSSSINGRLPFIAIGDKWRKSIEVYFW